MIWQDIVISMIGFLFGFILIPQIKDSLKGKTVNVMTSSLTAIGLYILGAAFITLGLWLSAISSIFSGTMWLILFIISLPRR